MSPRAFEAAPSHSRSAAADGRHLAGASRPFPAPPHPAPGGRQELAQRGAWVSALPACRANEKFGLPENVRHSLPRGRQQADLPALRRTGSGGSVHEHVNAGRFVKQPHGVDHFAGPWGSQPWGRRRPDRRRPAPPAPTEGTSTSAPAPTPSWPSTSSPRPAWPGRRPDRAARHQRGRLTRWAEEFYAPDPTRPPSSPSSTAAGRTTRTDPWGAAGRLRPVPLRTASCKGLACRSLAGVAGPRVTYHGEPVCRGLAPGAPRWCGGVVGRRAGSPGLQCCRWARRGVRIRRSRFPTGRRRHRCSRPTRRCSGHRGGTQLSGPRRSCGRTSWCSRCR